MVVSVGEKMMVSPSGCPTRVVLNAGTSSTAVQTALLLQQGNEGDSSIVDFASKEQQVKEKIRSFRFSCDLFPLLTYSSLN